MRKQLEDFLIDLSEVYPISESRNFDKIIGQYCDYLLQFCINKEIDFKKVRNKIFDTYKFKGFPDMPLIRDCLKAGEISKYINCKDEGCLVVIRAENNIYSIEVAPFGRPIEDIKADAGKRFSNSKVEIYPRGSVLIGDKVITP